MIKPTKYKSISTSQLKLRQVSPLNDAKKTKVFTILQKLSDLIKLQHS
jgi:hypothetical protein